MASDESGQVAESEGSPSRGRGNGSPPAPPFEPGNAVAVKAGTRSPRLVDPLAQDLAQALLDARPDLAPYPHALAAWARAEARCLLLSEYQQKVGLVNQDKGIVQLGADITRFERLASQLRQSLGLDPRAEAELVRAQRDAIDPGDVLKGIIEHGRRVLAERAAIEAGT